MPSIEKIMAYEAGEMNDEQTVAFFQEMVIDGSAWRLQGSYGRIAQRLIERGHIDPANKVAKIRARGTCETCKRLLGSWNDDLAVPDEQVCECPD